MIAYLTTSYYSLCLFSIDYFGLIVYVNYRFCFLLCNLYFLNFYLIFLSHHQDFSEPQWVKALTRDIFILFLVLKEISQFSIKSAVGFPWIILYQSKNTLFLFLLGLEFLFLDRSWMLSNTFSVSIEMIIFSFNCLDNEFYWSLF